MAKEDVVFKGTKDGVLIRLNGDQAYEVLKEGLVRRLRAAKRFFRGATVTIDAGGCDLANGREEELRDIVTSQFGLHVANITNAACEEKPSELGFGASEDRNEDGKNLSDEALRSVASSVFKGIPTQEQPGPARDTLLLKRTLRSGQRVRYNGNVVILGDVNPGSEVIARGDVLVLGRLRGMVHAGALGDDTAIVAAAKLLPTQLRISRYITRPPEDDKLPPAAGPEVARVRDGTVIIDSYLGYTEYSEYSEFIGY